MEKRKCYEKLLVLLAVTVLGVAMIGCNKTEKVTVTEKEVVEVPADEAEVTEAPTEEPAPVEEAPVAEVTEEAATGDEQSVVGTIVDATMNNVVIQTEDGQELIFPLNDDTDKSGLGENGILIDDKLEVFYIGNLEDASSINVTKLVTVE